MYRVELMPKAIKDLKHIHNGDTMELHPQLIEKEGRNECVILPFQEYRKLTAPIHDYEDLMDLREAKEKTKGKKRRSS